MNIAIIIPTYSRPDLLGRAVKSALNQTVKVMDIIVVNDGPRAPNPVPGTRLLSTPGGRGPAYARNFGVKMSSADYICYLDDDDELLPNYVGEQLRAIGSHEFSFSRALFRYADGFETTDPEPNNPGPKRYYDPDALLSQNIAPVSSFIHTRKAFELVGGWDESLQKMEDWDFWGRMYIACGAPGKADAVTNVIHRGGGPSRGSGSPFSYSMACMLRDVVEARLRKMGEAGEFSLSSQYVDKFRVPTLGIVIIGSMNDLSKVTRELSGSGLHDFEVTLVSDGPAPEGVRAVVPPPGASNTGAFNLGLLMTRTKYVWLADRQEPRRLAAQLKALEGPGHIFAAGAPDSFVARRTVLEKVGGLDESLPLDEARRDLWFRASDVLPVSVLPGRS